jgi:hypothetical protein
MRRSADKKNSEFWMARARESRNLAESFVRAEGRRRMQKVAERYEREALRAVDRELDIECQRHFVAAD